MLFEKMLRFDNPTVPQIFIDGDAVGGFQELSQLNAKGNL